MTIDSRHQLENTRLKLQELEQLYLETKQGPATSERVRELTLLAQETDQSIQGRDHTVRGSCRFGCAEGLDRCGTLLTCEVGSSPSEPRSDDTWSRCRHSRRRSKACRECNFRRATPWRKPASHGSSRECIRSSNWDCLDAPEFLLIDEKDMHRNARRPRGAGEHCSPYLVRRRKVSIGQIPLALQRSPGPEPGDDDGAPREFDAHPALRCLSFSSHAQQGLSMVPRARV